MTLVIGTDEAGYGPNLGPLVVAATAWRLADSTAGAESVFASLDTAAWNAVGRPLWADSKVIHRGGDGFAALERGALAAVALAHGAAVDDWPRLAAAVGAIGPAAGAAGEWSGLGALLVPRVADREACRRTVDGAAAALRDAGLTLAGITCRAVYPDEFNRLLDAGLNKSDILSRTTLDLARALADRFVPDDTIVWCDRHGGRKSYASLVARHFAAPLVQPLEETPARSAYSVPARRLRIEFSVRGESRLPVAVASMTAKYVRELAMEAFNTFWRERVPGLRPTAGYPVDARRWRGEAAAAVAAAGIPADDLWRRA